MPDFYPFFLILFVGVFFSMVFGRVHVPWVVGLIIGGILVGDHGFGLVSLTPTIEFIAQIGLIFLMFMAGLETKVTSFHEFKGKLLWLSFLNGIIPCVVGFLIGYMFGYPITTSLLIGIIFISSSIAIVIPSLERNALLHTTLGQSVVLTSIIQDIASLVLLSVVLQNIDPVTEIPLYLFYPILLGVIIAIRLALPKIRAFLTKSLGETKDVFQQDFRVLFLLLIGTVVLFELLGLHPIIAGFFAGLVLSNSIKSKVLKDKIRTIAYGIFIPTFFITVGIQTDLHLFLDLTGALPLVLVITFGSILSKFFSGWIAGRMVGFKRDQALLFGVSSIPQLSTTLAVAFTAFSLGIIDQKLLTAMITLSVLTTITSPILMALFSKRIHDSLEKSDHART